MHEKLSSDTPLTDLYRSNRHFVICRTCKKKHAFYPDHDTHCKQQYDDFSQRHPAWKGCRVYVLSPTQIEALAQRTEAKKKAHHESVLNYAHNSDVKEAFQAEQTMTTTNLQSKANSATVGWGGATVDNTSNLYVDDDLHVVIAGVATAPGSDKCLYVFSFAGTNTTDLTPTGAAGGAGTPGTEGSLTFPSVSTLPCVQPLLGLIPYPVTWTSGANIAGHFNLARVYGLLPAFWGVSILNFSGFQLAASGNTIKHRGLFNTII